VGTASASKPWITDKPVEIYFFKSGSYAEPQPLAPDVDGDCVINAADIIHLVNYVFKAGPEPDSNCLTGPSGP
jgi:hypothetical protein